MLLLAENANCPAEASLGELAHLGTRHVRAKTLKFVGKPCIELFLTRGGTLS